MSNINVAQRLSDLRADLTIEVIITKEGGDLVRGFRAVEMLIDVCKKLSEAIFPGAPFSLRPLVVLEDIDAHSVIAWLRQDQGPEQVCAEGAIEYVNAAIVESAKWLSNCRAGADFSTLLRSFEALPRKSSQIPQPDSANLLRALCELQEVRASLATGDKVLFVAEQGGVLLDDSSFVPAGHLLRSAARWHLRNDATEILLIVRSPDYFGGNIWTVEYNGAAVEISIDDRVWLDAFANREIDVREGDVLRAVAITEQYYAADGTLLDAEIRISEIRETAASIKAASVPAQMIPVYGEAPPKLDIPSSSRSINLSYSWSVSGQRVRSHLAPNA